MQNKTDKETLLVSKSLPVVNFNSVYRLFSARKINSNVFGYKYCEIADALNLPMSSVKNRIRAARIYLKRLLDE